MTTPRGRALFVTDEPGFLDPSVDATVGLMVATGALGLDTWWCRPEDLALVDGRVRARGTRVTVRPRVSRGDHRWTAAPVWFDEHEAEVLEADSVDVVHLRIDPPVDARYLHTTYLLDLVSMTGTRVVNRPSGIRALHEKLAALAWPSLCPATTISASAAELREFVARVGTAVVKPVDGFAGHGVWLVRDDPAATALLESATAGGRHVIAQEYLPAVGTGNKRLFLLDGEILGAVLRHPAPDDFRIGPPDAPATVDADDRRIVAALGPVLREHGIAIAGLDVIDGRLIEINLTCPGGMAKTDALLGTDLSGEIVRRLHGPTTERLVS